MRETRRIARGTHGNALIADSNLESGSFRPVPIGGRVGGIDRGYFAAGAINGYSLTRYADGTWALRGTLVNFDAFKIRQRPLVAISPPQDDAGRFGHVRRVKRPPGPARVHCPTEGRRVALAGEDVGSQRRAWTAGSARDLGRAVTGNDHRGQIGDESWGRRGLCGRRRAGCCCPRGNGCSSNNGSPRASSARI